MKKAEGTNYMNKILEAFAVDNLSVNPAIYRGNSKYRKAIKAMYETAETLEGKLNDEEKQLFEQFCDAQSEESYIYELDKFIRGYRIGVLMMVEVFTETSDFILNKEDE